MNADIRRRLFPLTIQGVNHHDFMLRWRAMVATWTDPGTPYPGRPDTVDFSGALLALKAGHRVARATWFSQYVTLQVGYPDGIAINANTAAATGMPEGDLAVFEPYLLLRRGRDTRIDKSNPDEVIPARFGPWTPTNSDLLADDWRILAPVER